MRSYVCLFWLVAFVAVLAGCYPQATKPVGVIEYPGCGPSNCASLIVLLPGRGDRAADFERQGFIKELREKGIEADVVAVDLHIGYYIQGSATNRLDRDVIEPNLEKGYRRIWLVGISAGGMGSIAYEIFHPGRITGMVLLAPYLGEDVVEEIKRAGGLGVWSPADSAEDAYIVHLWQWIKQYESSGEESPRIYLGYGSEDRYSPGSRLFAGGLPARQVFSLEGGHNWNTWRRLWSVAIGRLSEDHSFLGPGGSGGCLSRADGCAVEN